MGEIAVEGMDVPINPRLKIVIEGESSDEAYIAPLEMEGKEEACVVRVKVDPDSETRRLVSFEPIKPWKHIAISEEGVGLHFPKNDRGEQQIGITAPGTSELPDVIFEASAASSVHLVDKRRERKRYNRVNTVKSIGRKALMLGAVYGVLASGGVIDKGLDANSDASEFVSASFKPEVLEYPATFDGIPLNDYPDHGKEFKDMFREEHDAEVHAVEAVAQLMGDLDSHSYDRIRERAKEFQASRDDIMTDTEFAEFESELGEAKTIDRLIEIANKYMKTQGFSYTRDAFEGDSKFHPLGKGVALGDVRNAILQTSQVLSLFPEEFIQEDLRNPKIVLMSQTSFMQKRAASSDGQTISIPVLSKNQSRFDTVASGGEELSYIFGGAGDQSSYNWRFAHEVGHNYNGVGYGEEESKIPSPVLILRSLIQRPTEISGYGATDEVIEHNAELFAALISGDRDGIAHPDEVRRFESKANKEVLQLLIKVETKYPGLADYIISSQDRLMNRDYWDVGR
jgi:hypothetical protein